MRRKKIEKQLFNFLMWLPLIVIGFYFVGWYTGENGTGTKVETIDSSLLQNYVLYAHWSLEAPIYLSVDGKRVHTIDSYIGEEITLSKITSNFSPDDLGMSGYSVQKWYIDENLTQEYSFDTELEDELTLYGTYEYFMNEIHFYPYLDECDMVLVMTVEPGYGGQALIPETLEKVRKIKAEILNRGLTTLVQVDGGINAENAGDAISVGADILVAGSSVFGKTDRKAAIEELKNS